MNFKILFQILIFLVFVLIKPVLSAPAKTAPTRITSDIIDIKRNSQIMEFIGNVIVKKGSDTMIADKMNVIYEEKDGVDKEKEAKEREEQALKINEQEKKLGTKIELRKRDIVKKKEEKKETTLKRIDAYDNVKISSAEFVATGNKGHYEPKDELFILEENVVVNNGKSIANGEKFIYNLKTKKGNFVGKSKSESPNQDNRVVVTIGSDDLKGKKNKK